MRRLLQSCQASPLTKQAPVALAGGLLELILLPAKGTKLLYSFGFQLVLLGSILLQAIASGIAASNGSKIAWLPTFP
ncbi:MAG: hypothetical protein P4N60_08920 [Verrucomicrobiae bacterium]|nr:hypothetical protein [Verrucomicrobiae bacterium]